jgi:hypothetical protein
MVVLTRLELMIRGDAGRRVKATWYFALFLSIYGTFQIDASAVLFDGFVDVHNLSLLLSHISLEVAIYFVCIACLPDTANVHWLLLALIVAITLSTVTFVCGPASAPENPNLTQAPERVSYLIFEACSNFYVILLLCAVPLPHVLKMLRSPKTSESASSQIRSLVLLLALLAGLLSLVSRLVISTIAFLVPSIYISPTTMGIIGLAALLLVTSWPLVLLSNKLLLVPEEIKEYIEAVRTSVDLARLVARLNHHFKPICPDYPSWWDHLRRPSFHIYRSLITILDGKRKLANLGIPVVGSQDADFSELAFLRRSVLSVPDSLDYKYLVEGYRSVAKELDAASLLRHAMVSSTNSS